ncbi:MAG: hypothetical protein ACQR33_00060 [Candidatus Saccharibacteria bacterium]
MSDTSSREPRLIRLIKAFSGPPTGIKENDLKLVTPEVAALLPVPHDNDVSLPDSIALPISKTIKQVYVAALFVLARTALAEIAKLKTKLATANRRNDEQETELGEVKNALMEATEAYEITTRVTEFRLLITEILGRTSVPVTISDTVVQFAAGNLMFEYDHFRNKLEVWSNTEYIIVLYVFKNFQPNNLIELKRINFDASQAGWTINWENFCKGRLQLDRYYDAEWLANFSTEKLAGDTCHATGVLTDDPANAGIVLEFTPRATVTNDQEHNALAEVISIDNPLGSA